MSALYYPFLTLTGASVTIMNLSNISISPRYKDNYYSLIPFCFAKGFFYGTLAPFSTFVMVVDYMNGKEQFEKHLIPRSKW